jgi:hypothetical protein
LTKKKLELTRLPHELLVPRDREWQYGTPKREIEPLIDFWHARFLFYLLLSLFLSTIMSEIQNLNVEKKLGQLLIV